MKGRLLQFLFVGLMFALSTSVMNAQEPVDVLIDKYDGKKGFEVAIIGQDMIATVSQMPFMPKAQKKMFEQMEEMVMVGYSGKNPAADDMYAEAIKLFEAEKHTNTKDLTGKDMKGKAFTIEDGNIHKKISVVIQKKKSVEIMVIKGNFDDESFREAQSPKKMKF